jgi:hypothetical protein
MKALTRKVVFGLLATALVTCGGGVLLAGPPHPPHPPHPGPHPSWYHPPVIYPMPRPVVVYRPAVVYSTPLTVVASNPAPVADIRLVNPAENRATLRFTLNGAETQSLPAGYSLQISQTATIEFDRGGAAGRARYALTDGTYKFLPANGAWTLVRQTGQTAEAGLVADAAANPVPSN